MTSKQKRMRKIVQKMRKYIDTYDKQYNYDQYSDEIFINDMLYGVGIAIDESKYMFADGYDRWKKVLVNIMFFGKNK